MRRAIWAMAAATLSAACNRACSDGATTVADVSQAPLKEGDPCGLERSACKDKDHVLLCRNGKLVVAPCRGEAGCEEVSGQNPSCDVRANLPGEACAAHEPTCDPAGKAVVTCEEGRIVVTACPGAAGCVALAPRLACDSSDAEIRLFGQGTRGVASLPKIPGGDAEIGRVVVMRPRGEAPILFERRAGSWWIIEPISARADDAAVRDLLSYLRAVDPLILLDGEQAPLEALGLGVGTSFRVSVPLPDGGELDYAFGKAIAGQAIASALLRVGDRGDVFAVAPPPGPIAERDLDHWRDRRVLRFDAADVGKVEIRNEKGTLTLSRNGLGWSSPSITDLDEWRVDAMLLDLKALDAQGFDDPRPDAGTAAMKVAGVITLTLRGGGTIALRVGPEVSGGARKASRVGDATVYVIAAGPAAWALADRARFAAQR